MIPNMSFVEYHNRVIMLTYGIGVDHAELTSSMSEAQTGTEPER
jgi:hypothetical protein